MDGGRLVAAVALTRRHMHRWTEFGFVVVIVGVLGACSDDDSPVDDAGSDAAAGDAGPSRADVVQGFADGIMLPALEAFEASSRALEAAATEYADDPSDSMRESAQQAWLETMADWQFLEMMLVGPAGTMMDVAGGEDIRDEIYSWPLTNPCRVDQETTEAAYASPDLLAAERVNVRGLDALEYLLFDADEENACSAVSAINAEGTWAALGDVRERRARYVASAATLLAREGVRLHGTWRDTFRDVMVGAPSDLYASQQAVLNAISDALFYLDKEVKDMKLAGIAGVAEIMGADTRESRYANVSIAHVIANLDAFELVFTGGAGVGYDDLLVEAGAGATASAMAAAIDAAQAEAASLESDVPTLLAENELALVPLYDRVKAITDLLKTEFITALDLDLPQRAESDND